MVVAAGPGEDAVQERLRSNNPSVRKAISIATGRSPTLRALVEQLTVHGGVVYVTPSISVPQGREASLLHAMWASGGLRYLRILVRWGLPEDYLVAVIAHEVQHVLEVLEAPEVHDARSMQELFDRIGVRSLDAYETDAAREIQTKVFGELRRTATPEGPRNPSWPDPAGDAVDQTSEKSAETAP